MDRSAGGWTLLTNHARVLLTIARDTHLHADGSQLEHPARKANN